MVENIEKIEDSLKGGYGGLYGEIVTEDTYKIKDINWQPDLIFDFGANVGVFTRYVKGLFPNALVVSVEPDEDNYANLKKFTNSDGVVLLNKAIGSGQIYRVSGAVNGAHEVYISEAKGFPVEGLEADDRMTKMDVETVTVADLFNEYYKDGMKCIVKLDIEGNENFIWAHKPSMDALKKADYIVMELHRFALTGREQQDVNELTEKALKSFEDTHTCVYNHPIFYATKK